MRLILDAHIVIWLAIESPRLSVRSKEFLFGQRVKGK